MARNLTKRQAEAAFRQFKIQFKAFLPEEGYEHGPQLIKDWDWLESGPTTWAIVWEEGPTDWALLFPGGGTLEYGGELKPAPRMSPDVFVEPVTGWSVGLYPEYNY